MLVAAPASHAQQDGDPFTDGANNAKIHAASGFVCPNAIGPFKRDAVGERDPETGADFCAYSARDGVYGTITLVPIHGSYDPKALLAPDFEMQENTGGRDAHEVQMTIAQIPVYTRVYETAKVQSLRYRILFASAAIGDWAVDATVEYIDPQSTDAKTQFLDAVYADAQAKIAAH